MNETTQPWPKGRAPAKDEIERLYRIAYYVDSTFLRAEDVMDFGLDVRRLKEFGEVWMSKSVGFLRKNVKKLWDRMSRLQRSAFIMSDVLFQLEKVKGTVGELEKITGPCAEAHDGIGMIETGLFTHIPSNLRVKLDAAFGKWRSTAAK